MIERLKRARVKLARGWCKLAHSWRLWVPTNGLGWTGSRCRRCGYSYFGKWDEQPVKAAWWGVLLAQLLLLLPDRWLQPLARNKVTYKRDGA